MPPRLAGCGRKHRDLATGPRASLQRYVRLATAGSDSCSRRTRRPIGWSCLAPGDGEHRDLDLLGGVALLLGADDPAHGGVASASRRRSTTIPAAVSIIPTATITARMMKNRSPVRV